MKLVACTSLDTFMTNAKFSTGGSPARSGEIAVCLPGGMIGPSLTVAPLGFIVSQTRSRSGSPCFPIRGVTWPGCWLRGIRKFGCTIAAAVFFCGGGERAGCAAGACSAACGVVLRFSSTLPLSLLLPVLSWRSGLRRGAAPADGLRWCPPLKNAGFARSALRVTAAGGTCAFRPR